jgi:hypothetical protein
MTRALIQAVAAIKMRLAAQEPAGRTAGSPPAMAQPSALRAAPAVRALAGSPRAGHSAGAAAAPRAAAAALLRAPSLSRPEEKCTT